ncbi:MFS transporter [Parasphingorhabdus sp.]|uniref:MFS transporter n=1 Tax=Parasphingorhabdus sp. TaxID=2709688 RepID=UPI002F939CAB
MAENTEIRNEFSKGWTILLAGVLGVACGASPLPFNVIGFTVEPMIEEFGWSRTQILFPITIFGIIAALLAPFFGSLADKYGVRKVALYSLLAFGLSFAAVALTPTAKVTSTLYLYYALWVVVGVVGIGSTPVTWSRAINLWFYKHRGLALGILLMGTSLAAMVVPKLAVWVIESYGWREMFAVVALLPLIIALPVGYFLFREPKPEERPKAILSDSGNLAGVTLRVALKDYRFWLIWVSVAIIAAAFGGAFINLPTMLSDRGLEAQAAASIMGILGIGIFVGRLVTGALLDRFWQGFVAFPLLCLPALSCYILLGNDITFLSAALAGFLLGFAAGAESDLIAYLTGRYFGMANYGKIYGMLYMPFGIFNSLSPIIYASVRDNTGSYNAILFVAIFAFVIGGGILLLLGRYPENFPEAGTAPTDKPIGVQA